MKREIKNFLQELSPNACDIFKQKISDCKFWKNKPLTKNHKIKDLIILNPNFAKKVFDFAKFFAVFFNFFIDFFKKKLDLIFSILDLEISIPDLENSKRAFRKIKSDFLKNYHWFRSILVKELLFFAKWNFRKIKIFTT